MSKMRHLVDPKTEKWFHLDEKFSVWTCDCIEGSELSLCLSLCEHLLLEGEWNEIKHKIAQKRKELDFLEDKVKIVWPK